MRLESGLSAALQVNRSAWGRKGRIAVQIFGSKGTILFDQERFNEFQLYLSSDRPEEQGFRTVLIGPQHQPYGAFVPAPGHGLGFNDLKIVECRELIARIGGDTGARVIGFDEGLEIERTVHAMARSHREGGWVDVR
jgi:predicted dehydrogenase